MGGKNSTAHVSKSIKVNSTSSAAVNQSQRLIAQNFILVWVDAAVNQTNKDCQETLAQLRSVVNDVTIFSQVGQCVQFLNDINNEKAFVIVSGSLGQQLVPEIHEMSPLEAIYIFCGNKSLHEEWAKKWDKIQGVYTAITPICNALQLAAKQCNEDNISISFVSVGEGASSENLDQLEASFMYTQIFKEILLEIEYGAQSIKDLSNYCRTFYTGNINELNIINEFERDYHPQSSIWWYTRECFTYQMLNRALRNLEADTIINMGFFIRDLHRQLEQLHQMQVSDYRGEILTVYRGQSLSTTDFEKLCKTKGGLMSFNNFLSTSRKREISLGFAKRALRKKGMVGILFQMSIDPSTSSTAFAAVGDISFVQAEEEILFSMHTIFRIDEIKRADGKNSIYQVELQLTSTDDPQLLVLSKRIREETSGSTGWQRLGRLLLKIGQFNEAEELYNTRLEQTTDEDEKALYYHQLGRAKTDQGEYKKAIWYYEKTLEIYQKNPSSNHISLANSYSNIGEVYKKLGEYPKALSFNEKALEIFQKTLPPNHPDFATSYNNIAGVYYNMREYSKALPFYEKALEIFQKTLPPNHPSLATSYNNIGEAYRNMGQYTKALSFYDKDLEICQKSLPPNHPDLAVSYNNMGEVYRNMLEYSKALPFYEKALQIFQKTLPPNHPSLATTHYNMGCVYKDMGNYPKALPCFERALDIKQHSLPPNHPSIYNVRENIKIVKQNM